VIRWLTQDVLPPSDSSLLVAATPTPLAGGAWPQS